MKKLLFVLLPMLAISMAAMAHNGEGENRTKNRYELAERFTAPKLQNMLFSTTVDPHYFKSGDKFWYSYKTSNGTKWYVVDPALRKREPLFDHAKLASQLSEIMHDPFIAEQLPIRNLEVGDDNKTFTFEVTSSQFAKDENGKENKKEKAVFYFSYDYTTKALTHLKDKKKETKQLRWASVSPDGKTVVYAKDLNLYRMSREDYEKLKKDEKDSTVVEIQITTDAVKDFGYGQPYSLLNTDTLCNGKRKGVYGVWSPDSRYFVTVLSDSRAVKELWVINAIAEPRPTLESYKYQMPGEKEAPQYHMITLARRSTQAALRIRHSRLHASLSSISSVICTTSQLFGWAITTASS